MSSETRSNGARSRFSQVNLFTIQFLCVRVMPHLHNFPHLDVETRDILYRSLSRLASGFCFGFCLAFLLFGLSLLFRLLLRLLWFLRGWSSFSFLVRFFAFFSISTLKLAGINLPH